MTLPSSFTDAPKPVPKTKKETQAPDTHEKLPAPRDAFGNEVCKLFLKYGKCRYGKKCKLSHTKPSPDAPPPTRMVPVASEEPQHSIAPNVKFSLGSKRPRPQANSLPAMTVSLRGVDNETSMVSSSAPTISDTSKEDSNAPMALEEREQSQSASTLSMSVPDSGTSRDASAVSPQKKRRKSKHSPSGPAPLLAPYFVKPDQSSTGSSPFSSLPSSTSKGATDTASSNNFRTATGGQPPNPKKLKSTSNTTSVPWDRIEKWYISNRAELEPRSGRLMMTAGSPDSRGKKNQLKAMRRHHWECEQAIHHALERTIPKSYSLRLVRSRIDWPRVTPYLALVLQAAFKLDIGNEQLPVLAMTVQAQLEHNAMSGRALECLLVSWGLSELQARRCGNLIWEMMVSAAGDASVAEGRLGVGYIVRELESKHDFVVLQQELSKFTEQL